MIRAELTKGGNECRIEMHGHAEAERNEHDHDLVCAAASAMVQQLMWGVLHRSIATIDGRCEPGDVSLTIRCIEGHNNRQNNLLEYTKLWDRIDFLYDGLMMLAESYPECVEVTLTSAY